MSTEFIRFWHSNPESIQGNVNNGADTVFTFTQPGRRLAVITAVAGSVVIRQNSPVVGGTNGLLIPPNVPTWVPLDDASSLHVWGTGGGISIYGLIYS